MGLLDSDNMEYFNKKLFGYSEDDLNMFGNKQHNPYGVTTPWDAHPSDAPADRMYDKHKQMSYENRDKSFWDMLREGNIAGPFRRHFPLEQSEGYEGRREKMRRYK